MIRRATVRDAAAIAHVESRAAHAPWTRTALFETLGATACAAWVWSEGGDVVAHLVTTSGADVADVVTVAVLPPHRRKGIAKALFDEAVAHWRAHGVGEVFLEVRADNHPALGLYGALGWDRAGLRTAYYRDGTDAVVLKRLIRA